MGLKDKVDIRLNTKPEKIIAAASLSAALAILTTPGKNSRGGKGKKKKGIIARAARNYRVIDRLLVMSLAKDVEKNEKRILTNEEFKTKLRGLEIEEAIPFEPDTEET